MISDEMAGQASERLRQIWSPTQNVVDERSLWLCVLRVQIELGVKTPVRALADYAKQRNQVDLVSIRRRELVTRHDVKARIEEYNALAGHEVIHRGMTSHDVVDNISQYHIRQSCDWLIARDPERFAHLRRTMDNNYPLRGIKGPVGTMQDQVDLLGLEGAIELDRQVAELLGFDQIFDNTTQIYPRSIDHMIIGSLMVALADLHHPYYHVLHGYADMASSYQGQTWNEGDVSTSVIRRVALPGAFYAADAILNQFSDLASG